MIVRLNVHCTHMQKSYNIIYLYNVILKLTLEQTDTVSISILLPSSFRN